MESHAEPILEDPEFAPNDHQAVQFNHPDDQALWQKISPTYQSHSAVQETKTFAAIKECIKQEYRMEERQAGRIFKLLKRCLKISPSTEDAEAHVPVSAFIRMTKYFGPFKRTERLCVFLEQMQVLIGATEKKSNGYVSAFAGYMTQDEAENILQQNNIKEESYILRFSESLADQGGYSLAVKANAKEVRHYQIKGDPYRAARSEPYHAQLKLIHGVNSTLNDNEDAYKNIATFMKKRLLEEIEDNVYCTHICPGLPFNALFRGYD